MILIHLFIEFYLQPSLSSTSISVMCGCPIVGVSSFSTVPSWWEWMVIPPPAYHRGGSGWLTPFLRGTVEKDQRLVSKQLRFSARLPLPDVAPRGCLSCQISNLNYVD
ncbi:hypothetical protein QL285_077993 [Trifolium repens]|nr:hypothetical protein QL285_077993 [Trifolium repens]